MSTLASIAQDWLSTAQRAKRQLVGSTKPVRLIYLDGAGISEEEPTAVIATVVIKDRQWLSIERDANAIENSLPKEMRGPDFEFHGCELAQGSKKFPRNKQFKEHRFKALREFLALLGKYKLPVFYSAFDRDYEPSANDTLVGLSFMVSAFQVQNWFTKKARMDVGLFIADKETNTKTELMYKSDVRKQRRGLSLLGPPLTHIIDTIHFADSRESVGLQLADCAAYAIKRHLMNPNDELAQFYELVEPRIETSARHGQAVALGSRPVQRKATTIALSF